MTPTSFTLYVKEMNTVQGLFDDGQSVRELDVSVVGVEDDPSSGFGGQGSHARTIQDTLGRPSSRR